MMCIIYPAFTLVCNVGFLFDFQHVTDLSGRETLVRITGKEFWFSRIKIC